jgi:hypothetical protein
MMTSEQETVMKIKSKVRAGAFTANHNATKKVPRKKG